MHIMDLDKLKLVKIGNSGLVKGLRIYLLLPQLPQKLLLSLKVVKRHPKIIISLNLPKFSLWSQSYKTFFLR